MMENLPKMEEWVAELLLVQQLLPQRGFWLIETQQLDEKNAADRSQYVLPVHKSGVTLVDLLLQKTDVMKRYLPKA